MPVARCECEVPMESESSALRPAATPHHVLIVDDEPLVRWSLAETLRGAGYNALEAGDATGAFAQVEAAGGGFDAILLDLWLTGSVDWRVLEALHTRVTAPIIVMSAHGTRETAHQALALGAYAFLNKPFSMSDIVRVVNDARAEAGGATRH